ncbi:hypothetical protein K9M74_00875 [Candidatus Woesearchaeota archaeon]|nr:hypothetical protein [Candidatus Woesearchaeota archaeon]
MTKENNSSTNKKKYIDKVLLKKEKTLIDALENSKLYELEYDRQTGVERDTKKTRITFNARDTKGNSVFIKIPFPTEPETNKQQITRVVQLRKALTEVNPLANEILFRIVRDEPLFLNGLYGIVTERGHHNLQDYFQHTSNQQERANTTFHAIQQSTRGMQLLHQNKSIVCDFKPTNLVFFSDDEWMIVDPESFKPLGSKRFDPKLRVEGSHSSSGRTKDYADWQLEDKLHDPLSILTDWYAVGTTLFEAYYETTPNVIFQEKEIADKNKQVECLLGMINQIPNEVHRHFMQRTMGYVLEGELLPERKTYTDFRFRTTEETRGFLEKGEDSLLEQKLSHKDYQAFLKSVQDFKDLKERVTQKSSGLEGSLTIENAEAVRSTYKNVYSWYANEHVSPLQQSKEHLKEVEDIKEQIVFSEFEKMRAYLQKNKDLENKKIAKPMWEIFSKAMILGLNKEEKMYSLQDIEKLDDKYILETRQLINKIKQL